MSTANGYTNGHAAEPKVDPTAARRDESIKVNSPFVTYTDDHITSKYTYHGADVTKGADGSYNVVPTQTQYQFTTDIKTPKTGLMLIGLGGNNGTTVVGTVLANKLNISWNTTEGTQTPNYLGSIVRGSTIRLGTDPQTQKDVYVPLSDVLPTVHPNDLVVGGWDISGLTIDKATRRAKVLDYDLQRQLEPLTKDMKPLPSIYYPDFIAANQEARADNLIPGTDKKAHLDHIRKDIRDFKASNGLDKVIVLWTANTERYAEILPGVNDTAENLLASIERSHDEIAPSTIFAVASILENAPFINGAPQNTLVPGLIALAEREKAFLGGDDFKSGQTKFKSVLAEFLVNAGIKPLSIASYNHLGNNDGMNLSSQRQFKSKEISKASVVDDMVEANHLLYKPVKTSDPKDKQTEHPDHVIVIKYMPAVGDNKRAMDEYYSELCMGGRSVISVTNICQDSLLAVPLILDLTLMAELLTRVSYTDETGQTQKLYSVMSLLSYMLKAPVVRPGTDVVNGLSRQRGAIEHFLRALIGLQPLNEVTPTKMFW